ncbi:MAG: MBL fold metallo-hydrolase [SAR202 cluster bacterium]|nr:MBL fold metallo-hydrolase [SAR202 cluster bacterium]
MEIIWLGHSALRIRSNDVTLVTDPFADSVGYKMANQRAEIITVSNSHPHHSHAKTITGNPSVLSGPGEYEIGGFYISGIGTRLNEDGAERAVNTVFTVRTEGLVICHLGDLNQKLSPGQVQVLHETDVLIAPAGGGVCTIAASEVAALVNRIEPRILIPVHYRMDGTKVELGPLEGLLGELGVAEVTPRAKLDVDQTNLPREFSVVALRRSE